MPRFLPVKVEDKLRWIQTTQQPAIINLPPMWLICYCIACSDIHGTPAWAGAGLQNKEKWTIYNSIITALVENYRGEWLGEKSDVWGRLRPGDSYHESVTYFLLDVTGGNVVGEEGHGNLAMIQLTANNIYKYQHHSLQSQPGLQANINCWELWKRRWWWWWWWVRVWVGYWVRLRLPVMNFTGI